MDNYGKKAGKGPLIQEELSGTLGTSQDQYLFQAVGVDADPHHLPCVIHNFRADGIDGSGIAFALLGDHENRPTDYTNTVVFVKSKRAKSQDDDETWKPGDVANTLNLFDQGDVRTTTVICMATQQGGAEILEDVSPTVTAAAGMSGNNQPVICMQGNFVDREAKQNGIGWRYGQSPTLNTIDRHAVVYATGNGQVDNTNQLQDTMGALDCMHDQKIIVIDRSAYNQGKNAKFDITISDGGVAPTVIAKGPSAVALDVAGTIRANMGDNQMSIATEQDADYIVRRPTPLECCRLQGFPDGWGEIDPKDDFTQDEYEFWLDVRNTFARINGRKEKEYTKDQMLTWYNKLHTDSAEYKMWGNGIALPCAMYVMEGIAIALREGETDDE